MGNSQSKDRPYYGTAAVSGAVGGALGAAAVCAFIFTLPVSLTTVCVGAAVGTACSLGVEHAVPSKSYTEAVVKGGAVGVVAGGATAYVQIVYEIGLSAAQRQTIFSRCAQAAEKRGKFSNLENAMPSAFKEPVLAKVKCPTTGKTKELVRLTMKNGDQTGLFDEMKQLKRTSKVCDAYNQYLANKGINVRFKTVEACLINGGSNGGEAAMYVEKLPGFVKWTHPCVENQQAGWERGCLVKDRFVNGLQKFSQKYYYKGKKIITDLQGYRVGNIYYIADPMIISAAMYGLQLALQSVSGMPTISAF